MTTSTVVSLASSLRRLADEAGLQLLRAELLPVVVSVLHTHLGGTRRTMPVHEFIEQLQDDLSELRGVGFALPRTGQDYLGEWVRQGIIVRRPGAGREETIELSSSAAAVVRFVAGLEAPPSAVTSSRLSSVAEMLERLSRDTDPEPTSRLEALLRERDRLDAEIEAVEQGRFEPIPDDRARERLVEALRLAAEIPGDFARVSADFEALNRELREQIIRQSGSRGEVLEQVFSGVDLIEESEAGRTFSAFHALVLNPDLVQGLDEAIDAVLGRGFSDVLSREDVLLLRRLLTTLQTEAMQVRSVMTGFSRSLRRFVETREYREHRRLAEAIEEARAEALEAAGVLRPYTRLGLALETSSFPMSSVGTWKLRNPADSQVAEPVVGRLSGVLDLEALRVQVRESEIDFAELRAAVAETLEHQPVATVGDVLRRHPASQGLASVVGLLVLADSAGTLSAGFESLSWTSAGGRPKTVGAARYLFIEVPPEWKGER